MRRLAPWLLLTLWTAAQAGCSCGPDVFVDPPPHQGGGGDGGMGGQGGSPWNGGGGSTCFEVAELQLPCRSDFCLTENRTGIAHASALELGADGTPFLAASTKDGLRVSGFDGDGWTLLPEVPLELTDARGFAFLAPVDAKKVWLAGPALFRWEDEEWTRFDLPEGTEGLQALMLHEGAPHALSSAGTLLRFDPQGAAWSEESLPLQQARTIVSADGELWVSGLTATARLREGRWTVYEGVGGEVLHVSDASGAHLCDTLGALRRLEGGSFERIELPFSCRSITDAERGIFVAGRDHRGRPRFVRLYEDSIEELSLPSAAAEVSGDLVRWDGKTLWYASSLGGLHRLNDGCWQQHQAPGVSPIRALAGADEASLFAVGERGYGARWSGAIWERSVLPTWETLVSAVATESQFFVVGDGGGVFHRISGGWSTQPPPNLRWASARRLAAVDGEIFLLGEVGMLRRFAGGEWESRELPVGIAGHALFAAGEQRWLLAGRAGHGATQLRRLEGQHFELIVEVQDDLLDAAVDGAGTLYVSGSNWLGRLRDDATIEPIETGAPAERLHAVAIDGDDVWLAGPSGLLGLREDGREVVPLRSDQAPLAVADGQRFRAERLGVFVHEREGEITRHQLPTTGITDIWTGSADDVFVVGLQGAIGHWDGKQLRKIPGHGVNFTAVHGVGSLVVAATSNGRIVCVRSGAACSPHSHVGPGLLDVGGSAFDDLWAVGRQGRILHFDGMAWRERQSPTSADLLAVFSPLPGDVWIVSRDGEILRLQEEGFAVVHVESGAVNALGGRGADDVYFAGDRLLHWNGEGFEELVPGPWMRMPIGGIEVRPDGAILVAAGDRLLRGRPGQPFEEIEAPFGALELLWQDEGSVWLESREGVVRWASAAIESAAP